MADLPLSYGNPFQLIGAAAGVSFTGDPRLDRPFEPTHIVGYAMAGSRGNLSDVTLDGAPTTATANGNQVIAAYVPPTDLVQEFKVQTATFDAQFGQTQGGVTNISMKSGTNTFHGTARYNSGSEPRTHQETPRWPSRPTPHRHPSDHRTIAQIQTVLTRGKKLPPTSTAT